MSEPRSADNWQFSQLDLANNELDRLRAEIERLRADLRNLDELYAQRMAEIERLTAALREIHHATSFTMLATNYGRRGDIAFEIADVALEGRAVGFMTGYRGTNTEETPTADR